MYGDLDFYRKHLHTRPSRPAPIRGTIGLMAGSSNPYANMITFRPLFSALAALAIAGCATSGKRAYIAATSQTVIPVVEEAQGPVTAHVIYIQNLSTVPVTVYSVTLRSCENVKQQCDAPAKRDVRVRPGGRSQIQRVEPRNPNQSFGFRYTYGWRADSGAIALLSALAEHGSVEASEDLAAIERADSIRRTEVGAFDDYLELSDINALGAKVAAIRVEPDSLIMSVGETITLDRVRVMLVDEWGERLGRVRQVRWQYIPGALAFTRPDTLRAVKPGRSGIEFTLPVEALGDRAVPLAPGKFAIIVR